MSDTPTKPSALVRAVDFEGHRVTTVVWEGRPVWIAREVGEALEYADGSRLVDKVTGEWAEEFIEGVDFEMLANGRLAEFRSKVSPESGGTSAEVSKFAGRLVVVTESGLHLLLLKTRKPAGRRLRRLLATEVLPQLARTGRYAPTEPPPELPRRRGRAPSLPVPQGPTEEERARVRRAVVTALGEHPETPFEDAALIETMLIAGFLPRKGLGDPPELLARAAVLLLRAAGRVRWDRRRRVDAAAVTLELARMTTEPAPDPTAPH